VDFVFLWVMSEVR